MVHAHAATAAGVATATATNPIQLVKTRLQLDKTQSKGVVAGQRYNGSIDCARKVIKQEGIKGLYRGLSASYLGTIETALHLVLYEQLKLVYRNSLNNVHGWNDPGRNEVAHWISTSGASGSAKLATVLLTYPHEAHPLSLELALANCCLGGKDKIASSASRERCSPIYWSLAMFSSGWETGRDGGAIWWLDSTYSALYTISYNHFRGARVCFEVFWAMIFSRQGFVSTQQLDRRWAARLDFFPFQSLAIQFHSSICANRTNRTFL